MRNTIRKLIVTLTLFGAGAVLASPASASAPSVLPTTVSSRASTLPVTQTAPTTASRKLPPRPDVTGYGGPSDCPTLALYIPNLVCVDPSTAYGQLLYIYNGGSFYTAFSVGCSYALTGPFYANPTEFKGPVTGGSFGGVDAVDMGAPGPVDVVNGTGPCNPFGGEFVTGEGPSGPNWQLVVWFGATSTHYFAYTG